MGSQLFDSQFRDLDNYSVILGSRDSLKSEINLSNAGFLRKGVSSKEEIQNLSSALSP